MIHKLKNKSGIPHNRKTLFRIWERMINEHMLIQWKLEQKRIHEYF